MERNEVTLKVGNIRLGIKESEGALADKIARELRINRRDVLSYKILKKSVDARKKDNIFYNISLAATVKGGKEFRLPLYEEKYEGLADYLVKNNLKGKGRVIVVGSGPAGLFASLTLAYAGYKVILVERGKRASERKAEVDRFRKTLSNLDTENNIQFGEGGAGTFSDGKLNTGVTSEYIEIILKEFVRFGAPQDILYLAKPHIGTDYLVNVVGNMRDKLIELGGEVYFSSRCEDIIVQDGKIKGIKTRDKVIDGDKVIFAIGHSARDTFEMLLGRGVSMENKVFSMGVRIEHLQEKIGRSQYGDSYKLLPPADYKLSCHTDSGRSCYTFCMCPGGEVVPAASEEGGVVTNGMSIHARDGRNANSALLVNVDERDYGEGILAGMEFQRKYERKAYAISGSYKAPVSRFSDFKDGRVTKEFGEVIPTYGGVVKAELRECLPEYIADTIKEGIEIFDRKIRGFADSDAVLTGIESRSSSPVRILRDDGHESNIKGLYPCGEGAGYAGGITSAAIDGIKTAIKIISRGE